MCKENSKYFRVAFRLLFFDGFAYMGYLINFFNFRRGKNEKCQNRDMPASVVIKSEIYILNYNSELKRKKKQKRKKKINKRKKKK